MLAIPVVGLLLLVGCSSSQEVKSQPPTKTSVAVIQPPSLPAVGDTTTPSLGTTAPTSATAPSEVAASQPAAGTPTPRQAGATTTPKRATNATIIKRSTVPVLCWHQIREFRTSDSAYARTLITPPRQFARQLAALREAGFETISPDQLYDHLVYGTALPDKPVLLSLDDGWESEWVGAAPALRANNMVATYFITTQGIDYRTWISSEQLKQMQAAGMTIGDHTTSHGDSRHYTAADWRYQLNKSLDKLKRITGAPVRYFAYPYGAWNRGAFAPLTKAGIKLAFQLTDKPIDQTHPLLTQRRMMVDSRWSPQQMLSIMKSVFRERKNRESNY